ncbi:MAG: hypothetical protein JXA69_07325 [Phycisphaerae bacterium]|nr:hypothetical protein [Phycisphaerae bacterium]
MIARRRAPEDFEAMRRRILGETEAYLADALRHPEDFVRIPRHRVGSGWFPPQFAAAFWNRVLSE